MFSLNKTYLECFNRLHILTQYAPIVLTSSQKLIWCILERFFLTYHGGVTIWPLFVKIDQYYICIKTKVGRFSSVNS